MPSDITQAIEMDQIGSTLLNESDQQALYVEQNPQFAHLYEHGDGEDGTDYGQEQEQSAEESQELSPEEGQEAPTEEQRAEYMEQAQQWQSLAPETQSALADQHLQEAYGEAYDTITPQVAASFTNDFGKTHWGIDNLSERIEPQAFAPFAEVWSDNTARTISLHPHGEQFLEAIGDDRGMISPGYIRTMKIPLRAGREFTEHDTADSQKVLVVNETMAQRYYTHFERLLGKDLLQGYTPLAFAAKSLCDYARMENMGQQQQRQSAPQRGRQHFQTNTDLFDDQAMEEVMRRGLL